MEKHYSIRAPCWNPLHVTCARRIGAKIRSRGLRSLATLTCSVNSDSHRIGSKERFSIDGLSGSHQPL